MLQIGDRVQYKSWDENTFHLVTAVGEESYLYRFSNRKRMEAMSRLDTIYNNPDWLVNGKPYKKLLPKKIEFNVTTKHPTQTETILIELLSKTNEIIDYLGKEK